MKIAIISDTHFGYAWGTERQEDSFLNAKEAFEKALDSDLILLAGDIFDRKTPSQEVWKEALKILSIPLIEGKSEVKLVDTNIKRELSPLIFSGIPVIAIHGTHERRARGFVNPVELLEKMGYLIHLHGEYVVFEKNGERVAIHGMSGVPEKFASDVLKRMNFRPLENCYNILLIHQSIEGFVYAEEGEALKLEDLPDNFDLIVDGHIHWHKKAEDKNLIFTGSTISTQLRKIEAEIPKGFLKIDTIKNKVEFVELKSARRLIYIEREIKDKNDLGFLREEIMSKIESCDKKPILRLILKVHNGISRSEIERILPENVIKSLKLDFVSERREEIIRKFLDKRKSSYDVGMEILEKEFGNKIVDLFHLLLEERFDESLSILRRWENDKED